MHQTLLQFPEVKLLRRDGHKLRGYFANLFGQESDLFHNHDTDGKSLYRYPRVQYKVVDQTPTLLGLAEGAQLLTERFLQIREIDINGKLIPLQQKNMRSDQIKMGISDQLLEYEFATPWFPLNQENHLIYDEASPAVQQDQLKRILIRNILNVFTVDQYFAEQKVMVHLRLRKPMRSKFKNQKVLTFFGSFVTNAVLPDYIGLGKSVARGYGTIRRLKEC